MSDEAQIETAVEVEEPSETEKKHRVIRALEGVDDVTKSIGLRYDTRRDQVTRQFAEGVYNALKDRIPRKSKEPEAKKEPETKKEEAAETTATSSSSPTKPQTQTQTSPPDELGD